MSRPRLDELGYLPAIAAGLVSAALIGIARLVQLVDLVDQAHDIDFTEEDQPA